jgi:hypothetical protein
MSRPRNAPRYSLLKFIGDALMTMLTGGLWLIWVFIREMRYNANR